VSTSGTPWAIVVLGVVAVGMGLLCIAVPDAVQVGDPTLLGAILIGGGAAVTALGAGAVRRQHGHRRGRAWTVAGLLVLAATAVVVGGIAGDATESPAGVAGVCIAGAFVIVAGVTISRGMLARRMAAPGTAVVGQPAEQPRSADGSRRPLHLDVRAVGSRRVDSDLELPARPVRMLHLWVFDERTNDGLIERWRTVGPVQLLRGGGALGGLGTLAAAVTGRVGDLIEETAAEVCARLERFDYERDAEGRFAVNTIVCNDRTWKLALDELVATADVVQMDLAGFAEDNRGCTYELGVIVDRVPVDRVLLVLDDATDVALLRRVLTEAWSRMDTGSPNRTAEAPSLVAVQAPLVGLPYANKDADETARIDRQEHAVFRLMLERALPRDRRRSPA
jgi:hypothetical protein